MILFCLDTATLYINDVNKGLETSEGRSRFYIEFMSVAI